jgi:hypothetical protein
MIVEDVTATNLAPFAIAHSRFVERGDISAPRVTFTFCGSHRMPALTGLADQCRHDLQWQ